jgi:hypothetical protein
MVLGKRTDTVQEFFFAGISFGLSTWEIDLWAILYQDCWDLLFNVGANPTRVPDGFVYDLCPPDARPVFSDRPALWPDHLFEGLFE